MAAQVEIDDLRDVGEAAEEGPEGRVVEARPAVHQHQRGLVAQTRPSGTSPPSMSTNRRRPG
jgi:hypothetical protein